MRSRTDSRPLKRTSSAGGDEFYTASEIARSLAHLAETHGRPCSCWACAYPHRPIQKRTAAEDETCE